MKYANKLMKVNKEIESLKKEYNAIHAEYRALPIGQRKTLSKKVEAAQNRITQKEIELHIWEDATLAEVLEMALPQIKTILEGHAGKKPTKQRRLNIKQAIEKIENIRSANTNVDYNIFLDVTIPGIQTKHCAGVYVRWCDCEKIFSPLDFPTPKQCVGRKPVENPEQEAKKMLERFFSIKEALDTLDEEIYSLSRALPHKTYLFYRNDIPVLGNEMC